MDKYFRNLFTKVEKLYLWLRQCKSSILRGFIVCILIILVGYFTFEIPLAKSYQSPQLPFGQLRNEDGSDRKVYISDACENGTGGTPENPHWQHTGSARYAVDFAVSQGTPVRAPVSGTVVEAAWNKVGYGYLIRIRENGNNLEHWIAHNSELKVSYNQSVSQGQLIALSGDTGTPGAEHIHYHVQAGSGYNANPVDIRGQLPFITWDDPNDFCHEWGSTGYDGYDGFALVPPSENAEVVVAVIAPEAPSDSRVLRQESWFRTIWNYIDNSVKALFMPSEVIASELDFVYAPITITELNVIAGINEVSNTPDVTVNIMQGSDQIGSIVEGELEIQEQQQNPILQILSIEENLPLEFVIRVKVRNTYGDEFNMQRICVVSWCQESIQDDHEYRYSMITLGPGSHSFIVQYRRDSHNNVWENSETIYSGTLHVSQSIHEYSTCDTLTTGITLTSGSECLGVLESVSELATVGWGDRPNLSVTVYGDVEAWFYDHSNFEGIPYLLESGQTMNLGNNISSVDIREPRSDPPPPLNRPLDVDSVTFALYHFDEGQGTAVYDEKAGLNGTASSAAVWVPGPFGTALDFSSVSSGRSVNFGAMDVCPLTFEAWVNIYSTSNVGMRLAGQLPGNGNVGPAKWLIYYDAARPAFSVWSSTGSQTLVAPDTQKVSANQWHYLMVTYDCGSKQAKMYINGEEVGSKTMTIDAWQSGATTLEVGSAESIYHFDGAVDEVRISNYIRKPVFLDMDLVVGDPTYGEVTAALDWVGASYDWHIIDWGDNSDFGMQGYTGPRTPGHNYAVGSYTAEFSVKGADGLTYVVTDTVTIDQFACDSSVTLPGVVLYDYRNCGMASSSDHVQFESLGKFDLADFGLDNQITALHFPQDNSKSVRFYRDSGWTGESFCRGWDHWDLSVDTWPSDGASLDNSISSIEIFSGPGCVPPPQFSMNPWIVDPHGLVQVDLSWSGTSEGWQTLRFGTGDQTGWQGTSGSQSPQYWYLSPGTYTVEFEVENAAPNWEHYVITDTVTIGGPWACGSSVQQTGVVFYQFSDCSYRHDGDYEQFETVGFYNLSEMDNQASSLHIPDGMSVMLYEGLNQTGQSKCVAWDPWNFASDNWPDSSDMDNTISSVKVFSNSTCTD